MTVSELVDLLDELPARQRGWRAGVGHSPDEVIEVTAADVVAVDAIVADDGRVQRLWVTAVGDSDVVVPALISWPCRCVMILAVNERVRLAA